MLTVNSYLDSLKKLHPEQVLVIEDEVNPASFEVTAILQKLENAGKYPLVYFTRPLNLKGEVSRFPVATNVFAARERCAVAMGVDINQCELPLSLEYARREARLLPPQEIPASGAPVKEVVKTGDEADLREFPIVRHHEMDAGTYIDMTPIMRDPETGKYNVAFLRNMYKGPRKLGLHMSPRHNWEIVRRNDAEGRNTPVVIVVSHHPSFYLAALNIAPFETDDYEAIGSIMGKPMRLTASETWGKNFMVPADADILIEGEVLANVKEVEAPFGEFTGYYGPQRYRWVIDVKAITHRKNAIYQDIFVGHRDNWILGAIPKEGTIYNRIKAIVPTVKAVHLPNSGCGRFNCYISLDKKTEGDSKQAALIALGECDFLKNVIVVDADIDAFNEEQVMWSVATRVQADEDIDILKKIKGNTLDPSLKGEILTAKMIIDATRPIDRPYAARVNVPQEAVNAVNPKYLAK
ncbi:MAG: UbiD family decarboxylase [Dehalococcoidales bacterium]|nr:UbiD family decarboxylase [Dehalococcoidales bacterium]